MAEASKTSRKKTATSKKTSAAPSAIRRVAVLGGNRIPFARSNTVYSKISNQELLTSALRGLVDRYGLEGLRLGEVAAGAVIKHSRDFNLTREAVMSCGLAPETPAYDIQQACGTGLEAAILVANKIALGQIECGIAGGTDTTSDAPIGVGEGLREILLDLNRAKTAGQRLKILSRFRPGHLAPEIPQNGEPRTGMSMGEHCQVKGAELVALGIKSAWISEAGCQVIDQKPQRFGSVGARNQGEEGAKPRGTAGFEDWSWDSRASMGAQEPERT